VVKPPTKSINFYQPIYSITIWQHSYGPKDFIVNTSKLVTLQHLLTINPQTTPNPIDNFINKPETLLIITLEKKIGYMDMRHTNQNC